MGVLFAKTNVDLPRILCDIKNNNIKHLEFPYHTKDLECCLGELRDALRHNTSLTEFSIGDLNMSRQLRKILGDTLAHPAQSSSSFPLFPSSSSSSSSPQLSWSPQSFHPRIMYLSLRGLSRNINPWFYGIQRSPCLHSIQILSESLDISLLSPLVDCLYANKNLKSLTLGTFNRLETFHRFCHCLAEPRASEALSMSNVGISKVGMSVGSEESKGSTESVTPLSLSFLSLSHNPLGDLGIQMFYDICVAPPEARLRIKLETLSLIDTNLTNKSLVLLAEMRRISSIQSIDIAECYPIEPLDVNLLNVVRAPLNIRNAEV